MLFRTNFILGILVCVFVNEVNLVENVFRKTVSTMQCIRMPKSKSKPVIMNMVAPPTCLIQVVTSIHDSNTYKCIGYSSMKIGIGLYTKTVKITCKASYKMTISTTFQDGVPTYFDTSIVSQKFFSLNSSEPDIKSYEIKFESNCFMKRPVRYSIRREDGKGLETILLFVYKQPGNIDYSRVYWMPPTNDLVDVSANPIRIIEANQEIIIIPCIPYDDDIDILYVRNSEDWVLLPLNNSAVIYEPIRGFSLNTSIYKNYENKMFGCWSKGSTENYRIYFEISNYKSDLIITPEQENIIHYANSNSQLVLECSCKNPVKLEGTIRYLNGSLMAVGASNNITLELPQLRFIVRYQIVNLKPGDILKMNCIDNTSEILHEWNVRIYVASLSGIGESKNLKLHSDIVGIYFNCTSDTFNDVSLKYMFCDTPKQCRLTQSCLEEDHIRACVDLNFIGNGYSSNCTRNKSNNVGKIGCGFCKGAMVYGSGVIMCSAGNGQHKYIQLRFRGLDGIQYFYDQQEEIPVSAKISIKKKYKNSEQEEDDEILTRLIYKFECKIHRFFSEGDNKWLLEFANNTRVPFRADLAEIISKKQTVTDEFAINMIQIKFMSMEIKRLICHSPEWDTDAWIEAKLNVTITASKIPRIQMKDIFEFRDGEKNQFIPCETIIGHPLPDIVWTKGGQELPDPLFVVGNTLIFPEFHNSMGGTYACNASNIVGMDYKEIQVSEETNNLPLILGIIVGVSLVVIIILAITILIFRRKMKKLTQVELDDFFKGENSVGNDYEDQNGIQSPAQLPYPTEYEYQKEKIIIDKTQPLGSGEYGQVYLGQIDKGKSMEYVAVKIPKPDCPAELFKTLLSELKIMAYMGDHVNVIRLIGAYTGEIRTGVLYIAIEFCELGSLEEFLERNHGRHDRSEFPDLLPATPPAASVSGEYQVLSIFGFRDLLQWAYEMSAAMEFLSSRNIIHGDLATRNVLLTIDRVAKIADFGLSRRLYHYKNYVRCNEAGSALMPWRWLAIECLTSNTFSTQSDVWSFGITLWEMFSLGNIPYPGLEWNIGFGNQLKSGLRNAKPEYASEEIYQIMLTCWETEPKKRPSFSQLKDRLAFIKENATSI